ncbi:MAG: DUF3224 domain-containing protein [Anaerolineae bacterium]|nr:DUF3224 domain-containing protein [Anaerolineae bacterium]
MTSSVKSNYSIQKWDEQTWDGQVPSAVKGPKMMRISVITRYEGDLQAEGQLEYLMTTNEDDKSTMVGLEKVIGTLAGKSGSFVLQHIGIFDGDLKVKWSVVSGSGTGELRGLRAEGTLDENPITFQYDFE